MAFLTPAELLRIVRMRPELRVIVLPFMQAVQDATGKTVSIPPRGGVRSDAEQAALYAARGSNPYPVAMPGNSKHEYGAAVDLHIAGGTDDDYAAAASIAVNTFGLATVDNDRVHFELNEPLSDSVAAWADLQQSRATMVGTAVVVGLVLVVVSESSRTARG